MNRREFLRTAGGTAGATAAVGAAGAGPAAAAEGGGNESSDGGGGEPDFGGYLDDVSNFDGVEDLRGEDGATVEVGAQGNGGNFAFAPAAIHVDNGATVTWEWTGEGGSHNVVHEDGAFESELTGEQGFTFEQTFDEDGIYLYYCEPHKGMGMKGAVVVGSDYPTAGGGGGVQEMDPQHFGVPFQPHFVGAATILMMMVSLVFTFFVLKYGESAHTKGGNN